MTWHTHVQNQPDRSGAARSEENRTVLSVWYTWPELEKALAEDTDRQSSAVHKADEVRRQQHVRTTNSHLRY